MIWRRLANLLAQRIAEIPIFPHVAKIPEERAGGDEQAGEENPAAALVGELPHLAKADGDDESRQGGQNGERRERVAVKGGRAQNEPRGRGRRDEGNRDGDGDAPAFGRRFPRRCLCHLVRALRQITLFLSPGPRGSNLRRAPGRTMKPGRVCLAFRQDFGLLYCSIIAARISGLAGQ